MGFRYQRRRRRDDQNIDDWLITYADMITLILCFFAIVLSVSIIKKDNLEQARQRVMETFSASNPLKGNTSDQYDNLLIDLDIYKGRGGVTIKRGDRYTAFDMSSATLFDKGSAKLKPDGEQMLAAFLPILKSEKYHDYQISIEGHTDDEPISTLQFPSNWELSTARAAAVVRFFIDHGILPEKVRASGYADVFPIVPNRDTSGRPIPMNQAQNRRVVIKLERIEKE
jgi:chemotaxis protein MotB